VVETVVVRQAGPADVAAAAEVWYASHLARRGGRALPKERHDRAHERMAAPGGLLLVAEDLGPPDGFESDGARAGSSKLDSSKPDSSKPDSSKLDSPKLDGSNPDAPRPADAPSPVVGAALGEVGRENDGAGPPVPGLLHVAMVAVHPDRSDERVGRLLLTELLLRAQVRGYRQAQLWAHADNARTNRMCRAAGFRRTGRARIDAWGELLVQYRMDLPARSASGPA
jgi:ribosomal protein S18 acetylase RimI-like enzyme